MEQSIEVQSDLGNEMKNQEVEDPDTEKIVEDDDWITNSANFNADEDDLMDEDDLLIEDSPQLEKTSASEVEMKKLPIAEENDVLEGGNLETEFAEPVYGAGEERSPKKSHHHQTPPVEPSPSSCKKKKSSPRSLTQSVSLRKRKILLGRNSPKLKGEKSGPDLDPSLPKAHSSSSNGTRSSKALLKNTNKPAKVGNKPPKISR